MLLKQWAAVSELVIGSFSDSSNTLAPLLVLALPHLPWDHLVALVSPTFNALGLSCHPWIAILCPGLVSSLLHHHPLPRACLVIPPLPTIALGLSYHSCIAILCPGLVLLLLHCQPCPGLVLSLRQCIAMAPFALGLSCRSDALPWLPLPWACLVAPASPTFAWACLVAQMHCHGSLCHGLLWLLLHCQPSHLHHQPLPLAHHLVTPASPTFSMGSSCPSRSCIIIILRPGLVWSLTTLVAVFDVVACSSCLITILFPY